MLSSYDKHTRTNNDMLQRTREIMVNEEMLIKWNIVATRIRKSREWTKRREGGVTTASR
jgi:hypothetical protein